MQIDHSDAEAVGPVLVAAAPGVQVPKRIRATARMHDGRTVAVRAEWTAATGRYEGQAVTIEAAPGTVLGWDASRSVPIAKIIATGAAVVLAPLWPEPDPVDPRGDAVEVVLASTAAWYARALAFGQGPQQAVSAGLGVPVATAAKWIARARDRGLLTVVDPRWAPRS